MLEGLEFFRVKLWPFRLIINNLQVRIFSHSLILGLRIVINIKSRCCSFRGYPSLLLAVKHLISNLGDLLGEFLVAEHGHEELLPPLVEENRYGNDKDDNDTEANDKSYQPARCRLLGFGKLW